MTFEDLTSFYSPILSARQSSESASAQLSRRSCKNAENGTWTVSVTNMLGKINFLSRNDLNGGRVLQ